MVTLVNTPFGRIEGAAKDGVAHFLGVPYAEAPLGALRFRAPQPVEPWSGILGATKFSKDPIQGNLVFGPERYSEDCLYLNIWVPDNESSKMPVMLWVPGGAFATGGSGAIDPGGPATYDCTRIASDTGCIIVSISYRLNVFGFLNLSAFNDRFDDHIGMKDIIMAMRWVNQAIESFGGDADNVTLFGESAGGEAISALLLIDEARPYFHKAIIQSNCFGSFYTEEEEKEICKVYLNYAGLDEENVAGLLTLPYEQLIAAGRALDAYVSEHYTGRCSFCPVVDGKFLRGFPTLASFDTMDKPVLVGSNRNEGNFQAAFTWTDPKKFAPLVLQRLNAQQRAAILACYPELPSKPAFGELLTDVMYALPKIRFAERLSRGQSKVFVYRFDYYTTRLESLGLYACHVSELLPFFEFATEPYCQLFIGSENEIRRIGTRMHQYWGAFAHTGSPNADGLTEWKLYSETERNTMVIGLEDELLEDPEIDIRKRYEGIERILI